MKKAFLLFLILTGWFAGCRNPLENVELTFRKPLTTSVQLDFRTQGGRVAENVSVKIKGRDADQIVTLLNTTNFRISKDGSLPLATLVAPSPEKPLYFTIVATAENALETVVPIALIGSGVRRQTVVLTEKESNEAKKLVATTTGQSAGDGAVNGPLVIRTPPTEAGTSVISIPAGTRVVDAQNQPVDGPLTATVQVIPTSLVWQLPNGGSLSRTKKITVVASAFQAEIYNEEYRLVKSFSQPVGVTFGLNAGARNPATGLPVRAGDVLPLYSYDGATNQWKEEAPGKVVLDKENRPVIETRISHFSTWVVGYVTELCPNDGVRFSFQSQLPNDYDYSYRVEAFYVDGDKAESAGSSYYRLQNGFTFSLQHQLFKDRKVKLKVYDRNSSLVVESPVVGSCDNVTVPLDVRAFRPAAGEAPVKASVQFPCKNIQLDKLPDQVTTYYRESGSAHWEPFLTFNKSQLVNGVMSQTTYRVKKNRKYDFSVSVLSYDFEQPNTLIDQNEWVIKIKTKEFCQ
ncbi:hypothetical protein [Larkinella soli]|uniref:hypothetical protein n=1 Tax=Larkinella soli TaxID=1770527 RepID=UPI000FFC5221|nr:hypothetical protein [Larkinella soli]